MIGERYWVVSPIRELRGKPLGVRSISVAPLCSVLFPRCLNMLEELLGVRRKSSDLLNKLSFFDYAGIV